MNTIDTLKRKMTHAPETKTEAAAREARRRWEHARETLAERADALGDVAEEQWDHAREVAAPKVKQLRKKAEKALDGDFDLDKLQSDVSAFTQDAAQKVLRMGIDLRDASKAEADRVIEAIQESAEEARRQTEAADHRRRVRALIGWTLFGMVAGAVLATKFGPKSDVLDESAQLSAESENSESDDDESVAEGRSDDAATAPVVPMS